jgi:hypothetical protein
MKGRRAAVTMRLFMSPDYREIVISAQRIANSRLARLLFSGKIDSFDKMSSG